MLIFIALPDIISSLFEISKFSNFEFTHALIQPDTMVFAFNKNFNQILSETNIREFKHSLKYIHRYVQTRL